MPAAITACLFSYVAQRGADGVVLTRLSAGPGRFCWKEIETAMQFLSLRWGIFYIKHRANRLYHSRPLGLGGAFVLLAQSGVSELE